MLSISISDEECRLQFEREFEFHWVNEPDIEPEEYYINNGERDFVLRRF